MSQVAITATARIDVRDVEQLANLLELADGPVLLSVGDRVRGVLLSPALYARLAEAAQDAIDLKILKERADEPDHPYDDFVAELVAEGLLDDPTI